MVSVRYAPKEAPYISKGRWTLPLPLLHNEKLIERITERGIKLMVDITRDCFEQTDQQTANIQTHWESYTNSLHKIAKEVAKECHHKITS